VRKLKGKFTIFMLKVWTMFDKFIYKQQTHLPVLYYNVFKPVYYCTFRVLRILLIEYLALIKMKLIIIIIIFITIIFDLADTIDLFDMVVFEPYSVEQNLRCPFRSRPGEFSFSLFYSKSVTFEAHCSWWIMYCLQL
jgi:hypothetical protein